MSHRPRIVAVVAMLGTLAVAGCRSTPTTSRLMSERSTLDISPQQLRIQVRSLARPFGGILEETADSLAARSDDPEVHRMALEFKIDAIPAMHEALFQRDPLAAVVDAAALLFQMRDFFEARAGDRVEPDRRALTLAAVAGMQGQLEALMMRAGVDDLESGWRLVERWAAENPVEVGFASRPGTAGLLSEFTARTGSGALGSIATLGEDLDDITARVDVYVAHLAKQGRWQAELVLLDLLGDDGSLVDAIEGAGPFQVEVAGLPPAIDGLPDRITALVEAEHRRLEGWVRDERLDTLGFVRSERQAILAALAAERALVLEAMAAEREAAFRSLAAERSAMMGEVARVAGETMVEVRSELIDHASVRAAQVLGGLGLLAFLAAVVLVRMARRPDGSIHDR